MENIIWSWQFGWREGWTPDLTKVSGCGVNIKSIHKEEFCNKYVGSFINWCNLNWEVTLSMELPSKLVLSWLYQLQDLALKSPIIVVRKEPFYARVSNMISKLSEKVSKSSWD